MKNEALFRRVFYITSFLFLGLASVAGFYFKGDPNSLIPYSHIVIPAVHVTCCLASLICAIKPVYPLNFLICIIESILTILTGTEILGDFLFYAGITIFFFEKPLDVKRKITILVLLILHCLTLLLSYPHGWMTTAIAFGSSMFMLTFLLWIYFILKERLSCFLPTNVTHNKTIKSKQPGSELSLSEFGLTERQINLVIDYIYYNISYKELSEKYAMSLSLVKKEFNDIFQIFNVSKIEELYILLLQYQLKR